jgi:hypothetical protein
MAHANMGLKSDQNCEIKINLFYPSKQQQFLLHTETILGLKPVLVKTLCLTRLLSIMDKTEMRVHPLLTKVVHCQLQHVRRIARMYKDDLTAEIPASQGKFQAAEFSILHWN